MGDEIDESVRLHVHMHICKQNNCIRDEHDDDDDERKGDESIAATSFGPPLRFEKDQRAAMREMGEVRLSTLHMGWDGWIVLLKGKLGGRVLVVHCGDAAADSDPPPHPSSLPLPSPLMSLFR